MTQGDTDFVKKKMSFNANSVLLALLSLVAGVAGVSINRNVDQVDQNQRRMWEVIMPRTEVESRLETIRAINNRIEAELLNLRDRVNAMDVKLSKIKIKDP